MRKNFLFLIFFFAILTACAPQSAPTPTLAVRSSNIAPAVTNLATSTPTVLIPTSTPVPQSTTTVGLTEECFNLEQKIPDDLVLSGVWVINRSSPHLENLTDHMNYNLPLYGSGQFSTADGDMAISPDGMHMAYVDQYLDATYNYRTEKRVLQVIRSSGHALDLSYWQKVEDWQWIIGWIDNQNLAIATGNKDIVILNPFTGERRKFNQPEWVNFNSDTNSYRWDTSNYPLYNSTLEWILEHPSYESLDLKNVQTGETIWQTERSGWTDWTWAANSTTFAVGINQSIVIFKNGEKETELGFSKFGYDNISGLKLSPDGQRLAFNISKNYNNQPTVLDLAQHKVVKLCADDFRTWDSPIWSPDGRFVIENVHNENYQYFDLLVDTQEMHAYLLKSGYLQHPIAWLAQPSVAETALP